MNNLANRVYNEIRNLIDSDPNDVDIERAVRKIIDLVQIASTILY